jgi:hypothetical protein
MCTDTHNSTGTHTGTCKHTHIRTRTFIQIIAYSQALYDTRNGLQLTKISPVAMRMRDEVLRKTSHLGSKNSAYSPT